MPPSEQAVWPFDRGRGPEDDPLPLAPAAGRVVRDLAAIVGRRRKPGSIVSENGAEFTCNAMLVCCRDNGVDWHVIAPKSRSRMPCRALQWRLRDELLNETLLFDLDDAMTKNAVRVATTVTVRALR